MGKSEGPVFHVKSLKTIMSIDTYGDYEVFTLYVTSAFLNTLMLDNVWHKWMKFEKDVAAMRKGTTTYRMYRPMGL